MSGDLPEKISLQGMAGSHGFKVLTNVDSPYSYTDLIIGGVTSDPGILINGTQISDNLEAADLVAYEIASNGVYDPLWTRNNVITIPGGTSIKIIFGDKGQE